MMSCSVARWRRAARLSSAHVLLEVLDVAEQEVAGGQQRLHGLFRV